MKQAKNMKKNKLILIYGLKTSDYFWAKNEFYPIKRIADYCKMQNIEFCLFLPEDFEKIFNYFFSNFALPAFKIEVFNFLNNSTILLRGEIEKSVYTIFEFIKTQFLSDKNFNKNFNFNFTPKLNAKILADNKKTMYDFFYKHNFPFPKSVFVNFYSIKKEKFENIFENIKKNLGMPFVAKPVFGSQGRGVKLIENKNDFFSLFDEKKCKKNCKKNCEELIFQQFIKTSEKFSFDLRFFVSKNTVLACALRKSTHNFLSNFHFGAKIEIIKNAKDLKNCGVFNISQNQFKKMKKIAVRVIKKAGLLYGSADFLILQNVASVKNCKNAQNELKNKKIRKNKKASQIFLCEINASPGFEGIENAQNERIEIVPTLIEEILKF